MYYTEYSTLKANDSYVQYRYNQFIHDRFFLSVAPLSCLLRTSLIIRNWRLGFLRDSFLQTKTTFNLCCIGLSPTREEPTGRCSLFFIFCFSWIWEFFYFVCRMISKILPSRDDGVILFGFWFSAQIPKYCYCWPSSPGLSLRLDDMKAFLSPLSTDWLWRHEKYFPDHR